MARLIDGEWYTNAELEDIAHDGDGEYEREESTFREWIRDDPDAAFRPEAGRYHLYVSYACPWAHRTLITRTLLGLEDVVTVDVVDPIRIDQGWEFSPGKDGCTSDRIHGAEYLWEVYRRADPSFTGRVTVPVLWDRERETIVNNESEEIVKTFAAAFADLAERDLDLYPADRRDDIDAAIEENYHSVNNAVYRAGFAGSQAAYEDAVADLFDALARLDDTLADRRYLLGEDLTLADVCLFPTLYRFDEVYNCHFKCNHRRVTDYPNLWNYTREFYQLPGVAATCDMDHVKTHYYTTHESINPKRIVAVGPDPAFGAPHDRDRLPGGPPEALVAGAGV